MSEDSFMRRLDGVREDYNAPPETPRSEIWDAIESALEQVPPDEVLTSMRERYRNPPEVPREEMWSAIEAGLPRVSGATPDVVPIGEARRIRGAGRPTWRREWTLLATAAAALLVLGVGLGRLSVEPPRAVASLASTAAATGPTSSPRGSFRVAAVDYLTRTEAVLALVSSDARAGRIDAEISQMGRTLLLRTRLLLDSPAAQDQVIKELLEDLELILIQVARLSPGGIDPLVQSDELDLIKEGLDDNDMMLRIRRVLPAGSVQAGI